MQVLKSIAVLVIAYLAIGTVVGVVDSGLQAIFALSVPDQETGRLPNPGWLLWHVLEVGLVTVTSSYCVAFAVGRKEFLHVSLLGAWMVLVGTCNTISFAGRWPAWFSVGLMLVPIPGVLLGGYLRVIQTTNRDQQDPETVTRHLVARAGLWGFGLGILLAAHDYQNDPMYRRHFSLRPMFWTVELPFLALVGAGVGCLVGKWLQERRRRFPSGPSVQMDA